MKWLIANDLRKRDVAAGTALALLVVGQVLAVVAPEHLNRLCASSWNNPAPQGSVLTLPPFLPKDLGAPVSNSETSSS